MTDQTPPANALTDADVRRVATLSKLAVPEGELARERERLGAVLGYVDRLRSLDLEGVAPMTRASDEPARLRDDTPCEALDGETLARIAPDVYEHQSLDAAGEATAERFIRVPKVLGEGGA